VQAQQSLHVQENLQAEDAPNSTAIQRKDPLHELFSRLSIANKGSPFEQFNQKGLFHPGGYLEYGRPGAQSVELRIPAPEPVTQFPIALLTPVAIAVSYTHLSPFVGVVDYLKSHVIGTNLRGFSGPNTLHLGLLIPYFILLLLRTSYDLNRYVLFFRYYRYRRNRAPAPAAYFPEEQLPVVTVQLPVFNEQFVIDRLVDAVCNLNYPREKLEIQVLDDSTDETVEVTSHKVAYYAALGYDIHYLRCV